MALVELENIVKSFGKNEAKTSVLQDVSLKIESGEFIAITGTAGSGKTVLSHILGLLDVAESGSFHFDETDITTLDTNERAKLRSKNIGFLFRDFSMVPNMSAASNVELAITYDGVKAKDRRFHARRLLKQVGVADHAKKRVKTLSNGYKQRVALARALANKPKMLIADEPTGNLDNKTASALMKMLQKLNDRGLTILVMTDNPAIAAYAQRSVRIRNGHLQQPGNQSVSKKEQHQ